MSRTLEGLRDENDPHFHCSTPFTFFCLRLRLSSKIGSFEQTRTSVYVIRIEQRFDMSCSW